MRDRVRSCGLVAVLFAAVWIVMAAAPITAQAQEEITLAYDEIGRQQIPENCSTWHELSPNFCQDHHQDDYIDNGDGHVSACDFILLNGMWYHIEAVRDIPGGGIEIDCVRVDAIEEPPEPLPPPIPVPADCVIWHEVAPEFCLFEHQDGYVDNGDGVISECDYILLDGIWYHVLVVSHDPSTGQTYVGLVEEEPPQDEHELEHTGPPVPPNCSDWHETWPEFCSALHQGDYVDNGDGVVSECDYIQLDGIWYHITGVYQEELPSGDWLTRITVVEEDPPVGEQELEHIGPPVPPDCSSWHELWPAFCTNLHQGGYIDNGDGVVSECDYIQLEGIWYHITYVYQEELPSGDWLTRIQVVRAEEEHRAAAEVETALPPDCIMWHELAPDFCTFLHQDGYVDNGDGEISVCDYIKLEGVWYHIIAVYYTESRDGRVLVEISLSEPMAGAPESIDSSWGRIKSEFR